MKVFKEENFFKGWTIGNFEPSLFKTDDFECSLKRYVEGDYEESHHHKIATEITHIVTGRVLMNGAEYRSGDIILIEPGESTDFKVLAPTITMVVKVPCVKNDKYRDAI